MSKIDYVTYKTNSNKDNNNNSYYSCTVPVVPKYVLVWMLSTSS